MKRILLFLAASCIAAAAFAQTTISQSVEMGVVSSRNGGASFTVVLTTDLESNAKSGYVKVRRTGDPGVLDYGTLLKARDIIAFGRDHSPSEFPSDEVTVTVGDLTSIGIAAKKGEGWGPLVKPVVLDPSTWVTYPEKSMGDIGKMVDDCIALIEKHIAE